MEFTRKENGYLLAIREELESENDQLRMNSSKYVQQIEVSSYERQNLESKVGELREMLDAAISSNHQ